MALNANVNSGFLTKIAGAFKINKAEISVSGNTVSFMKSNSPAAMSLAFVPVGFNLEEVARINAYLQGKRGTDLEVAVQEAIDASDFGLFQKLIIQIKGILGDSELESKEKWASKIIGDVPQEKVPLNYLKKVATYGAAMELARDKPPQ